MAIPFSVRNLCKISIFGIFLRHALLKSSMYLMYVVVFYAAMALKNTQIWSFAKVSVGFYNVIIAQKRKHRAKVLHGVLNSLWF
ncbi:hypothetical protein QDY71_02205 [Kingella negevensis]|uniref:hypothetical protein n=1 Tax=Kingella negevensis TaxID=1522312 RepID=UPI0015DA5CE4|nr:hypothetical protein [Kingella negevensis]MDK4680276.1 hypothetical protein [Kingella negevensis]MDK4682004.1 hypothetical protein [Kingella negevensis]MDK4690200.1 hypothetical protein [Kingella negevensis]MDK4692455.1 hypothetical protein [Kingella negevensis]MDK4696596.1 hypothetical protein [Kingella negevensis]